MRRRPRGTTTRRGVSEESCGMELSTNLTHAFQSPGVCPQGFVLRPRRPGRSAPAAVKLRPRPRRRLKTAHARPHVRAISSSGRLARSLGRVVGRGSDLGPTDGLGPNSGRTRTWQDSDRAGLGPGRTRTRAGLGPGVGLGPEVGPGPAQDSDQDPGPGPQSRKRAREALGSQVRSCGEVGGALPVLSGERRPCCPLNAPQARIRGSRAARAGTSCLWVAHNNAQAAGEGRRSLKALLKM